MLGNYEEAATTPFSPPRCHSSRYRLDVFPGRPAVEIQVGLLASADTT